MKLETLLQRLREGELTGDPGCEVRGITHDSQQVGPGLIFAALPGEHAHGIDYLVQAVAGGAAAILTDRRPRKNLDIPRIKCKHPRPLMARAAWILAGNPQKKLGHEAYQTIGDNRIPFSDQDEVRAVRRGARCA